jgi:rare lipoprotein A
MHALTAAHKSLPFGSRLRVTNERTGCSLVVRINDRGPYAHGRVIDLSKAADQAVGISGVGKVKLTRL